MNANDNADRGNGRRDEDAIPPGAVPEPEVRREAAAADNLCADGLRISKYKYKISVKYQNMKYTLI